MNRQEMLLTILSEECGEVVQAVSKALRFGLEGRGGNGTNEKTNAQAILTELQDVYVIARMLIDENTIPEALGDEEERYDKEKRTRVETTLTLSSNLGRLS